LSKKERANLSEFEARDQVGIDLITNKSSWRGFPNTTRACSHKKYASRTIGTETVIGNSLKEVLADVLTKKNWKNQVRCFSSTQKGEKPQKS
jgi:hypothetical protein